MYWMLRASFELAQKRFGCPTMCLRCPIFFLDGHEDFFCPAVLGQMSNIIMTCFGGSLKTFGWRRLKISFLGQMSNIIMTCFEGSLKTFGWRRLKISF